MSLDGNDLRVQILTPGHADWQVLVIHLTAHGDARWVLDQKHQPKDVSLCFIGAFFGENLIGNLTLKKQAVVVPPSNWAGERDRHLRGGDGNTLQEMFVQTFSVDEAYRRKGIGRFLQLEGLRQTRLQGCYQMRSWSSLDKAGNYQLKLSLGFGFHPEIQETEGGLKVSGGYFVRVV